MRALTFLLVLFSVQAQACLNDRDTELLEKRWSQEQPPHQKPIEEPSVTPVEVFQATRWPVLGLAGALVGMFAVNRALGRPRR